MACILDAKFQAEVKGDIVRPGNGRWACQTKHCHVQSDQLLCNMRARSISNDAADICYPLIDPILQTKT